MDFVSNLLAVLLFIGLLVSGLYSSESIEINNLFPTGETIIYKYLSKVTLNDHYKDSKSVEIDVEAIVSFTSLWDDEMDTILKVQFTSNVNSEFYVIFHNGFVENLLFAADEDVKTKNIKKGLVNLLHYKSTSSESANSYQDFDKIMGVNIISSKDLKHTKSSKGNYFESLLLQETHEISLQSQQELGGIVQTTQLLQYLRSEQSVISKAQSVDDVISNIKVNIELIEESLSLTLIETINAQTSKLAKVVGSLREALKTERLGTIKSAEAFLNLFELAKVSSSEDISKALSSKKNVDILPQLYDLLGFAQTEQTHAAAMKHLHLDNEKHTDNVERYLWALSLSSQPNAEILEDLYNKYKKYTDIPQPIKTTLILSLASMSRNLPTNSAKKLKTQIEETIINELDYASEKGRLIFINALKNLQSKTTLPKLIQILGNATKKEEVLVWKALKQFGSPHWNPDVINRAEKTLYQLDRVHDSSARTLAIDILLGVDMSDSALTNILEFVARNTTDYEVRKYALQSLQMLAEKDSVFEHRLNKIVRSNQAINNYSALSPKGLSTALLRNMFSGDTINGSLVSIQEIKSGIVKRGVVDVVLTKNKVEKNIFTLGIFASGLSSFTSSDSNEEEEEEEEDEPATAGMELTILDTQIRPFVFFDGQGTLMGHVWSGTASEMTPAFQALLLPQYHQVNLRLANGLIVDIDIKGVVSFDLSGKVEISIWSRNSQSLIRNRVGYVTKGSIEIESVSDKAKIDFAGSVESELNLEMDADFSGDVMLCMRLSQPSSIYRQQITKSSETIKNKKPTLVTFEKKSELPGFTYALNRKNSEMCSAIFR